MRPPINASHADSLPAPEADALAHTEACAEMLREAIRADNGWLSFSDFMARALYAPGLGYYAAGARKFGQSGDFVTAPEISPLFGECIARSIAQTVRETRGVVLELGPGSGQLAFDVLQALAQLNAVPERYLLLEVSADLRERQQQKLAALPADLAARCEWISELPQQLRGAVIANEVLDVVPVHLVTFGAGWIFERGVALRDDQFVWQDVPALPADVQAMVSQVNADCFGHAPPEGYLTEFAPQVGALVRAVNDAIETGVALWIDYGFRRAEYYHPSRITGTLMCHYRHFAHSDPFRYPGLQDITAHVDFTDVAEAGIASGAELLGYCNQANFLLAAGITDAISRHDPRDAQRYLAITNQVQRLLSPAEMGEFFKVIAFGKGGARIDTLTQARQLPL
jgi:SAM-dependent MidA family methyltransferase